LAQEQQNNSDGARVEDVLRSSKRSSQDPDVEIFEALTELEKGDVYVGALLEQMVRDAYLD
jgi:hypothetical protein